MKWGSRSFKFFFNAYRTRIDKRIFQKKIASNISNHISDEYSWTSYSKKFKQD